MSIERKELNKRVRPKGSTRVMVCDYPRNIYFIDLMDFSSKKETFIQECIDEINEKYKPDELTILPGNRGYNYVLVVVDGYSRYIMTKLLNTKGAKEVLYAFRNILKENGLCNTICSDRGKEFVNDEFKTSILDRYNIKMYHGQSDNKSVFAEKAICDIKQEIRSDYIDSKGVWYKFIEPAVKKINNRVNRVTLHTPEDIFKNNVLYREETEPKNLSKMDSTPQFEVGDNVRIAKKARQLQKKSLSYRWSRELHTIESVDTSSLPVMYSVSGTDKRYYYWQLMKSKCKSEPKQAKPVEPEPEPEPKVHNTRHKKIDFSRYR